MSRSRFNRFACYATAIGALAITALVAAPLRAAEDAVVIPAPAIDAQPSEGIQTAVIAGGCFWGVQGVFQHTSGVVNAVSGYAGGSKASANYTMVSSGGTGHAEAVEIKYDPKKISYGKILQIFFSVVHNPTELNRQGPDTGPHYRTEIFPQTDEQAKVAKAYVAQLDAAKVFGKPIVTKTATMKATFYPAEAYHQDYATLHPSNPSIVFNAAPKLENLKRMFPDAFRDKPVLVAEAAK